MNMKKTPRYPLLPYDTILAATQGEPDAVYDVLRHYKRYIDKLATRYLYDEYGGVYRYVDDTIRARLEIRLIAGLLVFDAA